MVKIISKPKTNKFKRDDEGKFVKGNHVKSEFKKGNRPWNFGLTKETDPRVKALSEDKNRNEKIKNKMKNRYFSEEHRNNLRKSKLGKNNPMYGKVGAEHHSWTGGINNPYCYKFNNKTKEEIREKYDRCCVLCNKTEKENKYRLSVHHIDYNKDKNCKEPDWKMVPLCKSCHTILHNTNDKDPYENQIKTFLDMKEEENKQE